MSGLEIFTIVATVAGVISAFNDGSVILKKIKDRRRASNAPPPTQYLCDSLKQAPRDIDAEKERGLERFGMAFERGDDLAVMTLQQIQIDLQNKLIQKLVEACKDDRIVDFADLVDESDIARDRTMMALIELRQRLHRTVQVPELDQNVFPKPSDTRYPISMNQESVGTSPQLGGDRTQRRSVSISLPSLFRKRRSSRPISSPKCSTETVRQESELDQGRTRVTQKFILPPTLQAQSPVEDALNENPWQEERNVWQTNNHDQNG
ncbi:MAG: hypothetical protein Q9157_001595 [Trypethelium eluteriae]